MESKEFKFEEQTVNFEVENESQKVISPFENEVQDGNSRLENEVQTGNSRFENGISHIQTIFNSASIQEGGQPIHYLGKLIVEEEVLFIIFIGQSTTIGLKFEELESLHQILGEVIDAPREFYKQGFTCLADNYCINYCIDKSSIKIGLTFKEIEALHQVLREVINENVESYKDEFTCWADEFYSGRDSRIARIEACGRKDYYRITRIEAYNDFLSKHPLERELKCFSPQMFLHKMKIWCDMRGYRFIQELKGGIAYIIIGNPNPSAS